MHGLVNELGTYAIGYNKVNYKDVSGWYEQPANFVLSRDIMNDINGSFVPKNPITRGDLAFYLKNMSGQNYEAPGSNFKDVPKSHQYSKSIDWAYSTGLIKGYEDGTFRPDKIITRQELAVMLNRYTQIIAKSYMPIINEKIYFKDEKNIGGFAKDSVSYLQKAGVIGGRDNGKFDPLANVTRAECAKMITTLVDGVMYGRVTITPTD